MGTFTSIIHPDDGRELQIKCGHDVCETYKVGDYVDWFVIKDYPKQGYLLDDVYDSFSDRGEDDWVVIKAHKVQAVVPRTKNGYGDYQVLRERFGIKDLPDSKWTKEGWENKRKREEKWAKEREEFEKSIAHLSPKQQLAMRMMRPISRKLDYSSIAEKIFIVEEIK